MPPLFPFFMPFEWNLGSAQHLLVFFSMHCFPKGKDAVPVVPGVDEVVGPTHAAYEGMHSFRPSGNEKGPGRAQALVSISHLTLHGCYNVYVEFDVIVDEFIAQVWE